MKQSARKKISITKLTLARMRYIREHHFPFVAHSMGNRRDLTNPNAMHKDTMILEMGIEVLFNAICNALGLSSLETDKIAIAEYAMQQAPNDKYVESLENFVKLEYDIKQRQEITLEDRKKAVEEYRSKKNQEISDEWEE